MLALAFLCVYLLRQGLTTWLVFYLVETKGVNNFSQAVARVSGLELGGLMGSLYAGRLSDLMIARARPGQGFVGRRLLVVRGYLLGLFGALASLRTVPNVGWLQWLTVFGVGFFLYGPQVRIASRMTSRMVSLIASRIASRMTSRMASLMTSLRTCDGA